jgi:hypothetical protein
MPDKLLNKKLKQTSYEMLHVVPRKVPYVISPDIHEALQTRAKSLAIVPGTWKTRWMLEDMLEEMLKVITTEAGWVQAACAAGSVDEEGSLASICSGN